MLVVDCQVHIWGPPCVRIVVAPIEPETPGAAMKDRNGSIQSSIQKQSGGQVAAT